MRQFYCDLDPTVVDPHGQPTLRITHDWTEYDRKAVDYFMRIKQELARELGMKRNMGGFPDTEIPCHCA